MDGIDNAKQIKNNNILSSNETEKEVIQMNETQEKLYGLLENYLEYCRVNEYTDFKTWCEDNIDTISEAALLDDICEEVNYVADKLFDLRK